MEDANWVGGSIYISNLLAALSQLPREGAPLVTLKFLSSQRTPLAKRLYSYAVVSGVHSNSFVVDAISRVRRIHRGMVRRFPWIGRLWRAPKNTLYFPVFDTTQKWRKNLYWIPDFQPHYFPELFGQQELDSRIRSFNEIAGQQGILLLSSNAALVDFKKFYPDASVTPRVWSFCSSVEADDGNSCVEVAKRYALPAKFLYIANQFWRHKDHSTAFAALKLLLEMGVDVSMVCTGLQSDRRDPAYFKALEQELIDNGLQGRVHFLGLVPREDQIRIFRLAAAVLQPSRFEGWSTVIEDAKALGRPIIASDIAVHREQLVGVESAHLFQAANARDLADRIASCWPMLSAGPAPESESRASKLRDEKRLESAYQFAAIVEEAIAYPHDVIGKSREL